MEMFLHNFSEFRTYMYTYTILVSIAVYTVSAQGIEQLERSFTFQNSGRILTLSKSALQYNSTCSINTSIRVTGIISTVIRKSYHGSDRMPSSEFKALSNRNIIHFLP